MQIKSWQNVISILTFCIILPFFLVVFKLSVESPALWGGQSVIYELCYSFLHHVEEEKKNDNDLISKTPHSELSVITVLIP